MDQPKRPPGRPIAYPILATLEIGKSTFIPHNESGARINLHHARKRTGYTLISRLATENEVIGIQVWRLA